MTAAPVVVDRNPGWCGSRSRMFLGAVAISLAGGLLAPVSGAAAEAPTALIRVVAVAPSPGAVGVAVSQRITVLLSATPPAGAPMPTLVPPVAGKWWQKGSILTFVPAGGFRPWTNEHVIVSPPLAVRKQVNFATGAVSTLRVEELLSELGYLPLNVDVAKASPLLAQEPKLAALVPSAPQAATFSWRFPNVPKSLSALWSLGTDNVVTEGAVMRFEDAEGMPTDGVVGPQVWEALVSAVAARQIQQAPYYYLDVSETLPEKLVVWRDGGDAYTTPVNTGVPGANTATGTWPVYARFLTTTMKGTEPDGHKYDVQGVPWVAYFNGGDAVHGYWRSYYGYPQSNGCVELPISNAQLVWAMDPIGTLVTVTS